MTQEVGTIVILVLAAIVLALLVSCQQAPPDPGPGLTFGMKLITHEAGESPSQHKGKP